MCTVRVVYKYAYKPHVCSSWLVECIMCFYPVFNKSVLSPLLLCVCWILWDMKNPNIASRVTHKPTASNRVYFVSQFKGIVHHGREGWGLAGVWDNWSSRSHSQRAERDEDQVQLAFSFLVTYGVLIPHSVWVLLLQLTLLSKSLIDIPRILFLNANKLTMKINHHIPWLSFCAFKAVNRKKVLIFNSHIYFDAGIEPRTLHILGEHAITELSPKLLENTNTDVWDWLKLKNKPKGLERWLSS